LPSCPLVFAKLVAVDFRFVIQIFAHRVARNNSQLISETSGMMPNFADVEKFFARMTFKASGAGGHSYHKQFSTREILNAKAPEPGGGSTVEQSDYED
jgi:hypothetical protein